MFANIYGFNTTGMDIAGVALCDSCAASLEEEDLMVETSCYFCCKRGCQYCIEKCVVCNDRFCSKCSLDVYSYSYSDERICIDCNCDSRK